MISYNCLWIKKFKTHNKLLKLSHDLHNPITYVNHCIKKNARKVSWLLPILRRECVAIQGLNLTKKSFPSNFDIHGRPSKPDIFWERLAVNSRIHAVLSNERCKFMSLQPHLQGWPLRSKLLKMPFIVRLRSLIIFR